MTVLGKTDIEFRHESLCGLMQLNTVISQIFDRQLNLLLKLGQVLQEDGES